MFISLHFSIVIFFFDNYLHVVDGHWGDITMQCRDFENNGVDWWFIYKPPGDQNSFLDDGSRFIYLTSKDVSQRWRESKLYITGSGMLLNTLAPLYRKTYTRRLAITMYTRKEGVSAGRGLLLADEANGLWLQHSIPGYPLFSSFRSSFPQSEIQNGHCIACMSFDTKNLNAIADILKKIDVNVTHTYVPKGLRKALPRWNFKKKIGKSSSGIFKLTLKGQSNIEWIIFYKEPGTKKCLFNTFAKTYKIVLDIYNSNTNNSTPSICKHVYGVRHIKTIAITIADRPPQYIDKKKDRMRFAVSTAAKWQRTILKLNPQYWTCISDVDQRDTSGVGGMLTCINDYPIWRSFDNFKVAEPECLNL